MRCFSFDILMLLWCLYSKEVVDNIESVLHSVRGLEYLKSFQMKALRRFEVLMFNI